MKIRFATHEDIPVYVELGKQVHSTTRFKQYGYNEERMAQQLKAMVDDTKGTHCFFIAENDKGEPLGWLLGCIESHLFSEHAIASVISYGVVPNKRMGGVGLRLLTAFRKWAENRKAVEINAGVNSGVDLDKMDKFLRKLGFELTGGNYSLGLLGTLNSSTSTSNNKKD
jgi:N-acetylglutamate synthase-like GNAT family acetyltransferase